MQVVNAVFPWFSLHKNAITGWLMYFKLDVVFPQILTFLEDSVAVVNTGP